MFSNALYEKRSFKESILSIDKRDTLNIVNIALKSYFIGCTISLYTKQNELGKQKESKSHNVTQKSKNWSLRRIFPYEVGSIANA